MTFECFGRTYRAYKLTEAKGKIIGIESIHYRIAIAALAHKFSCFQDAKVSRDRRRRNVEHGGDFTCAQILPLQRFQNLSARGVGQCLKDGCGVFHT